MDSRCFGPAAVLVASLWVASPVRGEDPKGQAGTSDDAATPQGVWERARGAYRRGDFRTYVDTIAPDAHDECLCDVSFLLGEALGSGLLGKQQHFEELNGILRRHGVAEVRPEGGTPLDKDAPGLFGRSSIHAVRDKPGLYADMMGWLVRHRVGARVPAWLAADLAGVTTTGLTATATTSGGVKRTITFEKVGETWKIRLPPVCLDDLLR